MSEETVAAPAAAPGAPPTAGAPSGAPPAAAPPTAQPPAEVQTPKGDAKAAPEKVTYDLKAPEGMALSEAGLAKIRSLAEARGWSQEDAQSYVDQVSGEAHASVQASLERFNQQRETWRSEIQQDPELGQGNFERTIQRCRALTDKLDPDGKMGLRKLMDTTGMGDHPALVRMWDRMAQWLIPETGLHTSSNPSAPPVRNVAQKFYPGMNP